MKFGITIILLLISFINKGQVNIDSLKKVWNNSKNHDTIRLNAIYDFAWDGYLYTQPDSAYFYAKKMQEFAEKKGIKKYQAFAHNLQGISYEIRGNYYAAIDSYKKRLEIEKLTKNKKGIASTYNNLGISYKKQGNYQKAIECYTKSLKYFDEIKDFNNKAGALNNIGNIYSDQVNFKSARKYYVEALELNKKSGYLKGTSVAYNNLGILSKEEKKYSEALDYYSKSISIKNQIGDIGGIATSLVNIGNVYSSLKNYDSAIANFSRSLHIYESNQEKQGVASTQVIMGTTFSEMNNTTKAIELGEKSLKNATEIGSSYDIMLASKLLFHVYKKVGDYKKSLAMHEVYLSIRDTIIGEENKNEIVRQELKYTYEKQAAADSVKTVEEKKLAAVKSEQEQMQRYVLYVGLAIAVLFGVFMINRLRVTRRQKRIIEHQKAEVEKQKAVVEEQKLLVEEKQKEVIDSIHYAKRIQQALLPSEKSIDKIIKKHRK